MNKIILNLGFICCIGSITAQNIEVNMNTPHENNLNYSATYPQAIDFYQKISQTSDMVYLTQWGSTDVGEPLHAVILSKDKMFNRDSIRAAGKTILLINNGIHPGEPCGIDASMALARDLVNGSMEYSKWDDLVIVIIPVYNIGGAKNRNSNTRANQNGPDAYGFRGNRKNYDLNRDFIKCDSKNAQTFNQLFNYWSPDIFIDTHTSNGADYTYTMTLITTMKDKLEKPLHDILNKELAPYLYQTMKKKNWEMIPYVYTRDTPESGIITFLDHPRYSSGYAALHHTIAFMPETHMLKPFKDRVESTYRFFETMIEYLSINGKKIQLARSEAYKISQNKTTHHLNWELDGEKTEKLLFKGYTAKYKPSDVTGLQRLYYDHDEPYEKEIDFGNSYKPVLSVDRPQAYIVPQGYSDVIDRLKWNGVELTELDQDQELIVEFYRIKDYKTSDVAYEGHYPHRDVEIDKIKSRRTFYKGDYLIQTNQYSSRYLIEMLEPHAPDSYFNWNFFDGILMRKEYFSPYVFEELAAEVLNENPMLKTELEAKRESDPEFAKDAQAQLLYIYERSPYYEDTHLIYPVARLEDIGQIKKND